MRISRLGAGVIAGLFCCLPVGQKALSQIEVLRAYDLPVAENGVQLADPWTGGMHCPQFSPIDIDMDGKEDIFSFDRVNNRVLIYINTDDTPGQMSYKFTRSYNHLFPASLRDWVLLRDYNCDGLPDIFTRAPNAIRVFKNISTPESGLAFESTAVQLMADYNYSGAPFSAPLYCLSIDLPAIHDHDGDGDLDIFTFTSDATTVYFFESLASDEDDCESLHYNTTNACYGMFNESGADETIFIADEHFCGLQVVDPGMGEEMAVPRHAGGTLVFLDADDDGMKECIVADITAPNMTILKMMESSQGPDSAYFKAIDFPNGLGTDMAVMIPEMPGCYYFDQDNDGVSDLVCAPQSSFTHEDMRATWLFKNNGTETLPQFELMSEAWYQDRTIDIGTGSVPVLADWNGDGLADLFVSNHRKFTLGGQDHSKLWLYENIGTASAPEFRYVTDDYLGLAALGLLNICVTFGDLDGDGDVDMIFGEQSGRLYRYTNQAGVGNVMDLQLTAPSMTDSNDEIIDVGQHATPQLVDVDLDGMLDLIVGEKAGNLNYYRNTGTEQSPSFTLITEFMGEVQADSYFGINGYSFPHLHTDSAGTRLLFVGNELGFLQLYGDLEGNETGQFTLISSTFSDIMEGDYSAPFVSDINTDSRPDLFLGQMGGGLGLYLAESPDVVPGLSEISATQLHVYPNPAAGLLNARLDGMADVPVVYVIHDLMGKEIKRFAPVSARSAALDIRDVAAGFYLLSARTEGKQCMVRFVKE